MTTPAAERDWLTIPEVAQKTQQHYQTVRRAILTGKLEATKLGVGWRIYPKAVEQYIERQTRHVA